MIYLLLYVAAIVAANWTVSTFGIVPVLGIPGLLAPAGVYFAGLTFVLRNQTQETLGRRWSVLAIPLGAAISAYGGGDAKFGPLPIWAASGLTFLLSETLDYLVYSRIRTRGRAPAMGASCVLADVVDSAVFLVLAFGSLDTIEGQIIGKWLVVLPVVLWLWWRRRDLSVGGARA